MPLLALIGSAGGLHSLIRQTAHAAGWTVRELPWDEPVLAVSDCSRVHLVILIAQDGVSAPLLLDVLGRSGYDGPFVLLAAAPSPALRRRAFLRRALDVIAVPADPRTVAARIEAVLHQLRTRVSPPTP